MIVANRPTQGRSAAQPPSQNEMGWLVAAALAFLVAHIVALTIWTRASATESGASGQEAISSLYD